AHRAGVALAVVVDVAEADLLVVPGLLLDGLISGYGRTTGIDAGVASSLRLAVLGQAVVRGEGEVAVLAGVEVVHLVHQVAVGLEDVERVLLQVTDGEVAKHDAVRAVDL